MIIEREKKSCVGSFERHIHDSYEIYYLVKGEMRYLIGDEIYNVCAGDMVLIPAGVLHNTTYHGSDTERFLINFPSRLLKDKALLECFDRHIIPLTSGMRFEVEAVLSKMEHERDLKDSFSQQLIMQYISELLICCIRIHSSVAVQPLGGYASVIQRAVKYINENYSGNLSLISVSEKFGISKSYFSRKFKEITGFGFSEYLTLVRVSNAEKMLSESNMSVIEITFACGFNDSSYFASVFKKLFGVTPYKYAMNKRGNSI